jgi:hypothetical protein
LYLALREVVAQQHLRQFLVLEQLQLVTCPRIHTGLMTQHMRIIFQLLSVLMAAAAALYHILRVAALCLAPTRKPQIYLYNQRVAELQWILLFNMLT